jgi:transcriptional regulator with XRE-family HTH domain
MHQDMHREMHRNEDRPRLLSSFLQEKRRHIHPSVQQIGPHARPQDRIGRPVTQEEIAEALGVSRVWYATLETGATMRPSVKLLDRVAAVFELDDHDRKLLFSLAIQELGEYAETRATILNGSAPLTAYAAAVRSAANVEVAADALERVRERYLADGRIDGMPARSRIVASWDRCRACGVDPKKAKTPRCNDLDECRARNKRLLCIAEPILSQLTDQLAGMGYVTVIADAHGRILEMLGDVELKRSLAKAGYEPGGDCSEEALGTNAIGTAIADRRPVQVFAAEHYCAAAVTLTGTAAPIYETAIPAIIGVLSVTGFYRVVRQQLIGIVMQAADEIEERLALR